VRNNGQGPVRSEVERESMPVARHALKQLATSPAPVFYRTGLVRLDKTRNCKSFLQYTKTVQYCTARTYLPGLCVTCDPRSNLRQPGPSHLANACCARARVLHFFCIPEWSNAASILSEIGLVASLLTCDLQRALPNSFLCKTGRAQVRS